DTELAMPAARHLRLPSRQLANDEPNRPSSTAPRRLLRQVVGDTEDLVLANRCVPPRPRRTGVAPGSDHLDHGARRAKVRPCSSFGDSVAGRVSAPLAKDPGS